MNSRMISYIIPAHNAEAFLERAVRSIEKGYKDNNYEIIIVENGSDDGTLELAKQLTTKNECVKILISDKGVSNARNMGIDNAVGEWIAFVDADDYLLLEAISIMQADVENHNDVQLIAYGHEKNGSNVYVNNANTSSMQALRVEMLNNPTLYMQVWAKLFKRSIIEEKSIRFNSNMSLSEDSDFTLRYTSYCENAILSPKVVYHYSTDNVSVMRRFDGNKAKKYAHAMLETSKAVKDESIEIKKAFSVYVLMHLNIALVREVFCVANKEKFKTKLKRMRKLCKERVFEDAIGQVKIGDICRPRMWVALFLRYRLDFFAGLICMLRAKSNYKKEQKG